MSESNDKLLKEAGVIFQVQTDSEEYWKKLSDNNNDELNKPAQAYKDMEEILGIEGIDIKTSQQLPQIDKVLVNIEDIRKEMLKRNKAETGNKPK